jgi:dipeptidyl aminopeptidase/acylaminoacyl peptidase
MQNAHGQDVLSPEQLLSMKSLSGIVLHPDGTEVMYALYTPRGPNESPGSSHREYLILNLISGNSRPVFTEDQEGTTPQWSPDGQTIGFLKKGADGHTQVWAMPAEGGTAVQLTNAEANVMAFQWDPEGSNLAYLAPTPESAREKELSKRGYDFIFYEENLKNTNLYLARFDGEWNLIGTHQLTENENVWDFEFNHRGTQIAASISPKNLIDHRYMFRRIYLIDIETGIKKKVSRNEGKLGSYAFSPDDQELVYTAALNINDHQVSQLYVTQLSTGKVRHLTPPDFNGHVSWADWKDNDEILFYSGEGVWSKLSIIPSEGGQREMILDAAHSGIEFGTPVFSDDFGIFVFSGSTSTDPVNIYTWDGKGALNQRTDINSDLEGVQLGKQEIFKFEARDGQEIEGILIHPPGSRPGERYPLIMYIHGGPESHHSNAWLSRYSTPGQVMAGKGYLVAYLNYRASTGYGVDFAMEGFMDPAGKEFDDIADAIEYLVAEKGADADRVGLAGGSYGGYASAWFATYYTDYVKAVCMFVGISDLISKRGTTDIPYEDLHVHMGEKLEDQWQLMLERSPIYYAHQSKTATLIYGGAADTRVHPSQSFELYRRMKMNDHPAVRLVQYPGEGHGNRKQVGQIDVLYRQMDWFDWYVRDLKPLEGPMPPLDISDHYGLDRAK